MTVTLRHKSGTSVSTLPEAFQQTVRIRPHAVAVRSADGTHQITWRDYDKRVRAIAAGLASLGVGRGDTLALMLTNRPEFHLVDTAALHLGATPFSIYNTSSPEQISYLFTNAENKVVVTEKALLPNILAAETGVDHIVCVDGRAESGITLEEVEEGGDPAFDFDGAWQAVEPGDVATLIYTSGTTGPPKGVELTHANILAQLNGLKPIFEVGFDDRIISYLPSAHVADRVSSQYQNLAFGIQVTAAPDPKAIATVLQEVRPTIWFGVPRVWQKIKAGIEAKLAEEGGPKEKIARWAIGVGREKAVRDLAGQTVSLPLKVQFAVADKLLAKLRHALGLDEVKYSASGAAATPVDTLEFFNGLGIPVYEIWGMSETSGVTTTTRAGAVKLGTVGQPIDGAEVRLLDDGELLIRGSMTMRGYRKQPEKTAETVDADGWVHTGDIGTVDADGYVKIVDRKKELIINEGGKNMSPTNIENAVKAQSSLVGPVVAIGDGKPYNVALVGIDPDVVAGRRSDDPSVVKELTDAVREANTTLSRVEQIKRFLVLDTTWEPGGDELTPTMKLKRKPIAEKYKAEIDELYDDKPGARVIDLR